MFYEQTLQKRCIFFVQISILSLEKKNTNDIWVYLTQNHSDLKNRDLPFLSWPVSVLLRFKIFRNYLNRIDHRYHLHISFLTIFFSKFGTVHSSMNI